MNLENYKFKMPAEWTSHQRTLIEWPVKESLCWPENYNEVCIGYAEVAKAIAKFEPVTMLVNHNSMETARKLCGPTVDLLEIEHNDSWMRDNGPTFVINDQQEIAGINWMFNAWGEKYLPYDLDDAVASKVLEHYKIPIFNVPIVLEGGSIHVDGEGTLLTTEECLLNKNRNPDLTREEIEDILKKYLDVHKIIWLKRGLDGDETDGHIDNAACFAKPGVVILQTCHDPSDPNYEITQENLEILNNTMDAKGRKIKIVEIQQPPSAHYNKGRLTLSYLNFYFVNNGIILPIFGGQCADADLKAEKVLKELFPEREIEKVDGMSLIKEGGNVHCITQQMPAGTPAKL